MTNLNKIINTNKTTIGFNSSTVGFSSILASSVNFLGYEKRYFSSTSTNGKGYNIEILPTIYDKESFLLSLKNKITLLIKENKNLKISFYIQTMNGKINFWDLVEDKFAWSDNVWYDDDFKENGYNMYLEKKKFSEYSLICTELLNHKYSFDLDIYIKDIYNKLMSKLNEINYDCIIEDSAYTILIINDNKSIKSYIKGSFRKYILNTFKSAVPNNKRDFSSASTEHGKKKNVYTYIIDNKTYYLFSDLNNKLEFHKNLSYILKSLTKSDEYYEINYYLYLWTDDKNKILLNIKGENTYLDCKDNSQESINNILGLLVLEKNFEFKGYYNVITDIYNSKLYKDYNEYIFNIYSKLGEYVVSINENLSEDGFIEFKKSTVLTIRVINDHDNYTNSL